MITTLIFDIGNVLAAYNWQGYLSSFGFSPEKYETIANAVYRSKDWKELDRGVLSYEELENRFIRNAPQYEEEIRVITAGFSHTICPVPYTKDWLLRLRSHGYRLYYLSNYGEFAYHETEDKLDFISLMDGGLFSYEVKMIKPNPWIYAELCRRFQIRPEEAVFLDDSPANVEAAKGMGLHGIHFTDYDTACAELEKLGVH